MDTSSNSLENCAHGFLFGNYRLFCALKRGGISTIYQGVHVQLGNKVVVKVLNNWVAGDEQIKKFRAEARLHASLCHSNIVRILDFGMRGNIPFMVMDQATNKTLQEHFPLAVAVSPTTILPYVLSIAHALQYIHNRNIIHRDIKPQNILLGPANEVWLSDFGIAVAMQPWNQHLHQESVGTALYASPEQIEGHPLIASDQYSLAVLVYTWLSGQTPFIGSSVQLCKQHLYQEPPPLRDIVPALSPRIEQVVLKALAKDPYQRFSTIQDFADAFKMAEQESYTDAILPMLGAFNGQTSSRYTC